MVLDLILEIAVLQVAPGYGVLLVWFHGAIGKEYCSAWRQGVKCTHGFRVQESPICVDTASQGYIEQ